MCGRRAPGWVPGVAFLVVRSRGSTITSVEYSRDHEADRLAPVCLEGEERNACRRESGHRLRCAESRPRSAPVPTHRHILARDQCIRMGGSSREDDRENGMPGKEAGDASSGDREKVDRASAVQSDRSNPAERRPGMCLSVALGVKRTKTNRSSRPLSSRPKRHPRCIASLSMQYRSHKQYRRPGLNDPESGKSPSRAPQRVIAGPGTERTDAFINRGPLKIRTGPAPNIQYHGIHHVERIRV